MSYIRQQVAYSNSDYAFFGSRSVLFQTRKLGTNYFFNKHREHSLLNSFARLDQVLSASADGEPTKKNDKQLHELGSLRELNSAEQCVKQERHCVPFEELDRWEDGSGQLEAVLIECLGTKESSEMLEDEVAVG